ASRFRTSDRIFSFSGDCSLSRTECTWSRARTRARFSRLAFYSRVRRWPSVLAISSSIRHKRNLADAPSHRRKLKGTLNEYFDTDCAASNCRPPASWSALRWRFDAEGSQLAWPHRHAASIPSPIVSRLFQFYCVDAGWLWLADFFVRARNGSGRTNC